MTRSDQPASFFGDPKAGPGGCCGKPVGCCIDSKGCVHKVEKLAWQQRAAASAGATGPELLGLTATKYRSVPGECEAMRWDASGSESHAKRIVDWVNTSGGEAEHEGARVARIGGRGHGRMEFAQPASIAVRTINGWAYAAPGDFIVRGSVTFWPEESDLGVRDFYPCDPETFENRWEAV